MGEPKLKPPGAASIRHYDSKPTHGLRKGTEKVTNTNHIPYKYNYRKSYGKSTQHEAQTCTCMERTISGDA